MTDEFARQAAPTIAFAGGGTGGHLYPALAVACELRERFPHARIMFFGSDRKVDEMILASTGCTLVRQPLPVFRKAPWHWPALLRAYRAAGQACRQAFAHTRPQVVVGSGGFASVPAMLAARRAGIPTVLFNPDALPGRANRFLARRVDRVLVQWEESVAHFPIGVDIQVTGCPVRAGFLEDAPVAAEKFGLRSDRRTLLITGASQGARTLNRAVTAILDRLRRHTDWQVLHLTGEADHDEVCRAYAASGVAGVVLAYTHDMADALRAADLVVSRAGASTLAELTAVGRASILLPYPFHRDMHQLANATVLADAGAAVIVRDRIESALNGPLLGAALEGLMADETRRRRMAQAARRLGRTDAARSMADHVLERAATARGWNGAECVKTGTARTR